MEHRPMNENGRRPDRRRATPAERDEPLEGEALSAWEQMVQELLAEGLAAKGRQTER
jgi:hypothetical protein